ncbi:hypothetical protein QE152_g19994 [Popillia japonica]|uniref:Uncharacterized protein n=1 Tax=Popillia japonica TaxID=7064 RepID=A0AAW1KNM8_POPJA
MLTYALSHPYNDPYRRKKYIHFAVKVVLIHLAYGRGSGIVQIELIPGTQSIISERQSGAGIRQFRMMGGPFTRPEDQNGGGDSGGSGGPQEGHKNGLIGGLRGYYVRVICCHTMHDDRITLPDRSLSPNSGALFGKSEIFDGRENRVTVQRNRRERHSLVYKYRESGIPL